MEKNKESSPELYPENRSGLLMKNETSGNHVRTEPLDFRWLDKDILHLNKLIKSRKSPGELLAKLGRENFYFWGKKILWEKLLLYDLYNKEINFVIYAYDLAILRRLSIICAGQKLKRKPKDTKEGFKIYPQKALLNEMTLPITQETLDNLGHPMETSGNDYYHPGSEKIGNLRVFLIKEHDGALYHWLREKKENLIDSSNIILHFDAHSDMSLINNEDIQTMLKIKDLNKLKNRFSCFHSENTCQIKIPINLTNYLHYAVKTGLAKEIFWVMPDPDFCKLRLAANLKKSFILEIDGGKNFRPEEGHIVCEWEGIKIHILRLCDLPVFKESVLLDIDLDYFLNEDSASKEYGWHGYTIEHRKDLIYWNNISEKTLKKGDKKPWIRPEDFCGILRGKNITASLCTISLSHFYVPKNYHGLSLSLAKELGFPVFDKP